MKISEVEYLGELRTRAVHLRSSEAIITDAPPDNEGRGEAFSPTDLLATSLAACMFTLMGIAARKHGFEFLGGTASVIKEMLSNPRRVGKIGIHFELNGSYDDKQARLLEHAALHCPVAKSLNTEINQEVRFSYNGVKS